MATRRRDRPTRYAEDVVSGKIVAGPHVRAACKRHLDDLTSGRRRGLRWDLAKANRAIAFFEDFLVLAEDQHAGMPFKLRPWQAFIVGSIFGWLGRDGFRRFSTAYIEAPKGQGKTPIAAGVALYMLSADGEARAEVYSAATQRDQAKLAWDDAAAMVEASPELRKRLLVGSRAISHLKSRSKYLPVSAEGRGLDGKRVHCATVDELQEHPSAVVIDKLTDGLKGRRQALIFIITNSGFDLKSVAGQHHQKGCKVVEGTMADDSFFAYICGVDKDDDPIADESCWAKANPNLGVSITRKYLRKQVRDAKTMPARESGVRRVNFCQWVGAASPLFRKEDWDAVQFDVDLSMLERDVPCVGGLDLSTVLDLTAFALCFDVQKLAADRLAAALGLPGVALMHRPSHVVAGWFWTPAETARERGEKDQAPYQEWIDAEELHGTPGKAVDYGFVADFLAKLKERFQLGRVVFDPYKIPFFKQAVDALGVQLELTPHAQGFGQSSQSGLWMPRSVELTEIAVADRTVAFKRSPVMTWNASAAVVISNAQGARIFHKEKATGRIDGIVAAAMALGASETLEDTSIDDFLRNPIMSI